MFTNLFKKKTVIESEHGTSRRGFLALGAVTLASCIFPHQTIANVKDFLSFEKTYEKILSFYNTHTGESLKTVYWREGGYLQDALDKINYFLRDFRTGEVSPIDTQLLDLLFALHEKIKSTNPFHVICGYRSKATNDLLRRKTKKVAKNSLHIFGKAVDIRLPGYDIRSLRQAAIELQGGGVGYYPYRNYIHLDVGDVRYW